MKRSRTLAPKRENPTLQEFLAYHIDRSALTQREIANACGYLRPNIVSMIKQGETRLPLERLGAMADVLGVSARTLFDLWMKTHYAETWRVLEKQMSVQRRAGA